MEAGEVLLEVLELVVVVAEDLVAGLRLGRGRPSPFSDWVEALRPLRPTLSCLSCSNCGGRSVICFSSVRSCSSDLPLRNNEVLTVRRCRAHRYPFLFAPSRRDTTAACRRNVGGGRDDVLSAWAGSWN